MKVFAAAATIIAASALTTTNVAADGAEGAPWGYKANDTSMAAPDQWAEHYPTCGGQRQSPIDIVATTGHTSEKRSLTFSGSCADFNVSQSDESFTASVNGGSCAVSANGASYDMRQFHMHVPSEHTLDGQYLGGEVHFVHSNADSSAMLVTGVFFKAVEGQSDPWVVSVLDALDKVSANATASASLTPYADLVNKAADAQGVFNYAGSLTTPACSEIVDWWVVKKPVDASTADLARLQSQLRELHITDDGKNARPVQSLNGRVVTALL
ncbi:Carbonic anhydrase [Phytophthora cinnamomi]|uniref:Carbonic anhydrase n=1 Tax=Phytophthora cinnamomi TaxID=4785 RepID=UPI0035598806|nr:Carbonic anhydrase [Phytophthora cinnamomi]